MGSEGFHNIKTWIMGQLSVQQLVDCALCGRNDSCYAGQLYIFTFWKVDHKMEKESLHKRYKKCKHVGLEKVANISGGMAMVPNTDAFSENLARQPACC